MYSHFIFVSKKTSYSWCRLLVYERMRAKNFPWSMSLLRGCEGLTVSLGTAANHQLRDNFYRIMRLVNNGFQVFVNQKSQGSARLLRFCEIQSKLLPVKGFKKTEVGIYKRKKDAFDQEKK